MNGKQMARGIATAMYLIWGVPLWLALLVWHPGPMLVVTLLALTGWTVVRWHR